MKIFEPFTIRNMQLKNRIVMAPTSIGAINIGIEGKRQYVVDFYVERARGGVSAMILGGVPINYLNLKENLGQNIIPARYIDGMALLIDAIHKNGSKIGLQIWHTNQYPLGARGQSSIPQEWVAASPRKETQLHYIPGDVELREVTVSEIESIIHRFSIAAVQAKKLGADFVELHLGHGHMPNQFFSPIHNSRSDKYGGDLTGRMKFGIECVSAMRSGVGDYPIFVRLGVVDEDPQGINLKDSTIFAKELERAGADCLDITVGISSYQPHRNFQAPLKKFPMGTFVPIGEAIKKVVKIPVLIDGKLQDAKLAESVVSAGKADLIGICRQLITDPYWVQKIMTNRSNEIVACTSCNTWCYMVGHGGQLASHICKVTKRTGEETLNLRSLGYDTPSSIIR